jgi:hypothetical protein
LNAQIEALLKELSLPELRAELVRAMVLLWHDHLDEAHRLAQQIENADGSYVHGLMHRREPDYSNAKYWFRRVGRPSCFATLARAVQALLDSKKEQALAARLVPRGEWDPFAFIDACEEVAGQAASDAKAQLLRTVQAIEFEVLLEHFCRK